MPCLSLGYFWDDYYFLTALGTGDHSLYLLPSTGAAFFRPVSQGLYFNLLRPLGSLGEPLAHVFNLFALLSAVVLLVALASRLHSRKAGLLAGVAFASLGSVPSLVAWVSCSQDLFAIVLVLAALLLRHERRDVLALLCATVAVLCKETAIAAFPVLLLWDRLIDRSGPPIRALGLAYSSVALVWALLHPVTRTLLVSDVGPVSSSFSGISRPDQWGNHLVRYLLTLVNIPPPGFAISWSTLHITYGVVALSLIVGAILWMSRSPEMQQPSAPVSRRRIAVIALLLGVPTLLAPVVLIGHWASYFACFPGVALAIFVGPFLAERRTLIVLGVLVGYAALGVVYRGSYAASEPAWTEKVFVDASDAVRQVRRNFLKVAPILPPGSQVLLSVASTGVRGIQSTMIEGQALQVWYGDPTIRTVPTLRRRATGGPEYLVRVTTDLEVLVIDPDTGRIQATSPLLPDLPEVVRPIVNYARARAASGDIDHAVRIMHNLAQTQDRTMRSYYRRLSAAILLSAGRRREALQVLADTDSFSRAASLRFVKRLVAEPTESEALDESSFKAFGLSNSDPATLRWLINELRRTNSEGQAAWYATRLQALIPEDEESRRVLRAAAKKGIRPSRMPS